MRTGRARPPWGAVRVAYTLEQCWHRVPGGTAVAALEVAARAAPSVRRRADRGAPPATGSRRRPPWTPPIAGPRTCRCPGRRCTTPGSGCGDPAGAAGDRAGRRDPRHHHRRAAPHGAARGHGPRPGLPARARALHARGGRRLFDRGARRSSGATPTWCCARRWPRWPTARPPASTADRLRHVPLGVDRAGARGRRRRGRAALRPRPALPAVRRHARAPQEPGPPGRGASAGSTREPPTWCVAGPDGLGRRRPAAPATAVRLPRLRPRRRPRRALRRRRRASPTRACGRGSGCRCSRRWPRARRSSRRAAPPPRRSPAAPPCWSTRPTSAAIAAGIERGPGRPRPAGRRPGRARAAELTWAAHRRRHRWPPTARWPAVTLRGRRQPAVAACPGVVGGSEEYLARQLAGLAERRSPSRRRARRCSRCRALRRRPPGAGRPRSRSSTAPVDGRRRSVRVGVRAHLAGGAGPSAPPRTSSTTPAARVPRGPAGARRCVTIHDLQYLAFPEYFSAAEADVAARRRCRRRCARAAVVTVPSEFVQGTRGRRVRATRPSGSWWCPTASTAGSAAAPAPTTPTLRRPLRPARAGRRVPGHHLPPQEPRRRCCGRWPASAPGHDDVRLVLLGGAGPGRGRACAPTIEPARAAAAASCGPGRVPDADRDGLYRVATALAFPSRYEGFGAPVLEAMALGLPGGRRRRHRAAGGGRRRRRPAGRSRRRRGVGGRPSPALLDDDAERRPPRAAGRARARRGFTAARSAGRPRRTPTVSAARHEARRPLPPLRARHRARPAR